MTKKVVLTDGNLYELCRGRVVFDGIHNVEIVLEDISLDQILSIVQAVIRDMDNRKRFDITESVPVDA